MQLLSKLMMVIGAHGHATVTVSGHTIATSVFDPADAYARLKIDNDGKVYESEDEGTPNWVQIDTVTDWIRPAALAPDDYEVRYTNLVNDPLYSVTDSTAEDAWYAISGGDFILVQRSTSAPAGLITSTFDIEIRKGSSGGALDSGTYLLNATVEI